MRDRVRRRAESHSKGRSTVVLPDGVDRFEVKKGSSLISVIPYEVTVKDHPEQVPVGEHWYEKTFGVHYNVGPMDQQRVCPAMTSSLPCPICEEQARLRKDPEAEEDVVKALRPKERQLFNIEAVKDEPGVVQILELSYHLFGKQLEEEVQQEDDLAGFADIEGGKVIRVRFKKRKLGSNSFLEADRFDFKDRKELSNKILEQALDLDTLVQVPSYKELKKEFEGGTVDEDEDDDIPFGAGDKDTKETTEEWAKGDRVLVEIDGEDYAGTIKKIKDDEAKVKFDDGDVDTYPLDDLREEEADDDSGGEDDDSDDDDSDDDDSDGKGSGDDFDNWDFDDDDSDDEDDSGDDDNDDEDDNKGSSRRRRRRG